MDRIMIRQGTVNDIPLMLGLLYELGRPKPEKDSEVDEFRKLAKIYLNDSDKQILVLELNDIEIVGMVSIMMLPRLNRVNYEMYIPELIVSKKYQRQGLGKKLIAACISRAKEKKVHRIRLESANRRKESHQFYKNLGFKQSSLSFSYDLK